MRLCEASARLAYGVAYTDPVTGFKYLNNRYYDPSTGQFITQDPAVAQTGQPYEYADDNPRNNTDPTGLCIIVSCSVYHAAGQAVSTAWNDTTSVVSTVGRGIAAVAPGISPIVDATAGAGCVAEPELCPVILEANTGIQEVLVGAQKAYTPGYTRDDALRDQLPVVTGDALALFGGAAAYYAGPAEDEEGAVGAATEYRGLGTKGKAALSGVVGLPQIILDGALVGKASGAQFDCSP